MTLDHFPLDHLQCTPKMQPSRYVLLVLVQFLGLQVSFSKRFHGADGEHRLLHLPCPKPPATHPTTTRDPFSPPSYPFFFCLHLRQLFAFEWQPTVDNDSIVVENGGTEFKTEYALRREPDQEIKSSNSFYAFNRPTADLPIGRLDRSSGHGQWRRRRGLS